MRHPRSSRPATTTPRPAAPVICASVAAPARASPVAGARTTHGRPSARPPSARSPSSGSSSTSGSRSGKFSCTGPGRPLERSPHGPAGQRADPPQALGRRLADVDLHEPLRDVAVELELVDRLAGADLAQLRRAVGGQDDERHARLARLDDGRQVVRRPPSRSCRPAPPGARSPWPRRARRTPAPRSSTCEKQAEAPVAHERQDERRRARPGRRARAGERSSARARRRTRAGGRRCRGGLATWGGSRATVVLLHGFAGTRRAWDLVAERLDPERYRPLALDLRGHGEARDAPPDQLRRGDGRRPRRRARARFALVGYSLGGRVALHVALAAPERVGRLVLVATTAGIEDDGRARGPPRGGRRARRLRRAGRRSRRSPTAGCPSRSSPARRRRRARSPGATSCATTRRALAAALRGMGAGAMAPLWDRLGELRDARHGRRRRARREVRRAGPAPRGRPAPGGAAGRRRRGGHGLPREAPEAVAAAIAGRPSDAEARPAGHGDAAVLDRRTVELVREAASSVPSPQAAVGRSAAAQCTAAAMPSGPSKVEAR